MSQAVVNGEKTVSSVPERRPPLEKRMKQKQIQAIPGTLPLPVWRCRVCGYLCARDGPPEICPICRVKKDRFERFI